MAVEIYRLNNITAARAIILRMRGTDMKTYTVTLKIGDFRADNESRPTTIKELWSVGLHLMRLMKHNGIDGRFVVSDFETGNTIFWLYTKSLGGERKVRLSRFGYGKSCGGYTF